MKMKINMNKLHIGLYALFGLVTLIAYPIARQVMLVDISWYTKTISNIKLNTILLFFMYGITMDRLTRNMSKRKGWIVWGIGLIVLVMFFRFVGGFRTILG